MDQQTPLQVSYDAAQDVLTVEGHRYAGEFFRNFATLPLDRPMRIVNRQDGVVTVEELSVAGELGMDGERVMQEIETIARRFLGTRATQILNAIAKLRYILKGSAS